MKKWQSIFLIWMVMMTACSSGGNGEVRKDGKTVITLSVRESTSLHEAMERKFEESHPEIDLKIQASTDPSDYEAYQKTTNTALLSGNGADIFEISSLPIREYAEKGHLLNMDDWIKQDKKLNANDLEMNISTEDQRRDICDSYRVLSESVRRRW